MKNFWGATGLLLGSLLVSFVLGEGLLRSLGFAGAPQANIGNVKLVDDPVLNWRFVPHSVVKDGGVLYTYNSEGFRDLERRTEKAPGITRVLVVGDSVTEGSGVKFEDLFAVQLQNQLGGGYEVINLAMSGLNTPQEVHLLEVAGLQYKPDVVVLNFVLNDCDFFSEFHASKRFLEEKDGKIGLLGDIKVDPRTKRLIKSSALIYFVKGRVEHLLGLVAGKEESNYYLDLWNQPDCHKRIAEGFERLGELRSRNSFKVQVLIWPLLVDYKKYAFSQAHQKVKDEAERRGFEVLDLRDAFGVFPYRHLQVTAEDNVHPNELGHRVAVDAYVAWRQRVAPRDARKISKVPVQFTRL